MNETALNRIADQLQRLGDILALMLQPKAATPAMLAAVMPSRHSPLPTPRKR
jgi:hypothetical protein